MDSPQQENKPNDSQTTLDSLELLYEVSRHFAAALDLRAVLHKVLFLSMENVGAVSGSIIGLDDRGKPVESAFLMPGQQHDDTALQLHVTYEDGLAGWVARNKRAVLLLNTSQDERWLRRPDDAADRTGPKSAVSAPIMTREKLVGVITLVHPEPGFFTNDHLALVQAIADQAGIAILNARLYAESQRQAREMTAVAESLQAAHQRYRQLFEDSIDPIIITDGDGVVLEANQRAIQTTGLQIEQLRCLTIDIVHRIDDESLGEGFCNLTSGGTVSYESILYASKELEIPVEVYARIVYHDGVGYLQWIFRDITERKTMEKMRDDLIAMVYHDLRSPLSNVISTLEMLAVMPELQEDQSVAALIKIAERSTERVQRLTSSLLDINRLDAGQEIGERILISPTDLATGVLDAFSEIPSSQPIKIEVGVPDDLPYVLVDDDMIHRVLINLLENAIKFSPQSSEIRIGARSVGAFVEMWVDDMGPGIPMADRERIFEKFTRLDVAGKRKGLGLGLAFCRLAVEGHGGRIWVEDKSDKGARFVFSLPVGDEVDG